MTHPPLHHDRAASASPDRTLCPDKALQLRQMRSDPRFGKPGLMTVRDALRATFLELALAVLTIQTPLTRICFTFFFQTPFTSEPILAKGSFQSN